VWESLKKFLRNEDGATAIEYGLIAGILCIGVVGFVGALGDAVQIMYDLVVTSVVDAVN
jgi:pilus assembly protein Flp/PilA